MFLSVYPESSRSSRTSRLFEGPGRAFIFPADLENAEEILVFIQRFSFVMNFCEKYHIKIARFFLILLLFESLVKANSGCFAKKCKNIE